MRKLSLKSFLSWACAVFLISLIFCSFSYAQEDCSSVEECQALLEKLEEDISSHEQNISRTQAEKNTLNNKIYSLRQKIVGLGLKISNSSIVIKDLELQIEDTGESIEKSSQNIETSKEQLANILRVIYQQDEKSLLEILLERGSISDFFENLTNLESLLQKNQDILDDIKEMKSNLEVQETVLGGEKQDWESTKKIQILQKQENERTKKEKEWLLYQTKGEEAEYQKMLSESKSRVQEIRERLFQLVGVPQAPTFGQALEMAKYVENITGVRSALLLAVLTQESNIGKNVGQCYLKNSDTGTGVGVRTGSVIERVMKPMGLSGRKGDVADFLSICKELGRNPYTTLVSCPMSFGYGGAMGPAQFIPTTWALYKYRVSAITGKPADPWDIKDAFLGSGLLLRDAGASQQTYNAEWRAAMVYFSGSTNSRYSFYGDSVMAIVKKYEQDISQLEKFSYNK